MMSDLDNAQFGRWFAENVSDFSGVVTTEKFPGGQSNPTYRIEAGGARYVLRRKPFGDLLPSAHAVDREYRLLSALHPEGFLVPRPIALCEDESVIGSAFYVMEMVEGRTFWNGALPELSQTDRRKSYEALTDSLAQLHSIDYAKAGLESFGRPGNYFERQVRRWTKQYYAAQTDEIKVVERLIEWLPDTVPEQTRRSIIHGDYRIDNVIFAPETPEVSAVIDWELATIGDPLADFSYFAMAWVAPADGAWGLRGLDLAAANIPSLDDIIARYCAATGRDSTPDLHWYFAYNFFRLVGILQGVKRRMLDGNASSENAKDAVSKLPLFVDAAWEQAQLAGAKA